MMEARSVINGYRDVLSATTKFPRAGTRNVAVEEFVDLCVAVWESDGAVGDNAGWVIEVSSFIQKTGFNELKVRDVDFMVGNASHLQFTTHTPTYDTAFACLRR